MGLGPHEELPQARSAEDMEIETMPTTETGGSLSSEAARPRQRAGALRSGPNCLGQGCTMITSSGSRNRILPVSLEVPAPAGQPQQVLK